MGKIDIEKEKEFCDLNEFKKNEFEQFIFQSPCGENIINLPYILEEYKEFLINEGILIKTN